MTVKETGAIMDVLKAAYPQYYRNQSDEEKYNAACLWAGLFTNYPLETVAAAVKLFIASDTKGFPPVPGMIMDKVIAIGRGQEMSEMEAWTMVSRAIAKGSPYTMLRTGKTGYQMEFEKLPPEVQRIVGSSRTLQDWGEMPEDTVDSVVSSNFMRSYRARIASEREYLAAPPEVQELLSGLAAKMALPDAKEVDAS